jgi:hypothetical protein
MTDDDIMPLCFTCTHLIDGTDTCTAFPSGIPDDFLSGDMEHTKPYQGDTVIMYESII